MTQERLYKVAVATAEHGEFEYGEDEFPPLFEPEGWREYAREHPHIEDDANFFLPKEKIFRSRSAAKRQLEQITHWGIEARVVECTPTWEPIPDANARRARERSTR